MTILEEIASKRRSRIDASDHALSAQSIPAERSGPVIPLDRSPFLICEVKKRSPSRGSIRADMDAVEQVEMYAKAGVKSVSVLTEEEYFGGSLDDLVAVKSRFPDMSVLRKDFLLDEEDIRLSHRAGADAVLLIAALLDADTLAKLDAAAQELGLARLVEVHNAEDVAKARAVRAPLVGVNARDLKTFRVDRLVPLQVAQGVRWDCKLVFESGVFEYEDAVFARDGGFSGVLVGEAVVRKPERIPRLMAGLTERRASGRTDFGGTSAQGAEVRAPVTPTGSRRFWSRIAAKAWSCREAGRPLVKICGVTNRNDAELATELGADLLGFIFADSPRRAEAELLHALADLPVLKVAVVVADEEHGGLPEDVRGLLSEGLLDAVQLHGNEAPEACFTTAYPYYKALRPRSTAEADQAQRYRSPRVLFDAFDKDLYGGSGKQLNAEILEHVAASTPLWLAGGLGPHNVAEIIRRHSPELVDASSLLEAKPGVKDEAALESYFEEIRNAHGAS